ncbi:MAG TPA: hypothetical protein VF652_03670 [Allosphingosinicella sp.]
MTAVDRNAQEEAPDGAGRKPWQTPFVSRFAGAGAEAGDSGGGPDGDNTKS